MLLPHFVLAGAPKCGTSSLFSWLNHHPQLVGSTPKEPFYFMDREHPLMDPRRNVHAEGLAGWSQLFSSAATADDALYFEGTTHLMYQETALSVLPGLPTQPKFLFLLRDPVARIESSFNYTRENLARVEGNLSLPDYVELLTTGDARRLASHVPSKKSAYVLERDLEYSDYWRYLSRWLDAVGRERILVLQLESMHRNPLATVRQVCAFLGVSPLFFGEGYDFSRKNATVPVAHASVHRWAKEGARLLPSGALKQALKRIYYMVQGRTAHANEAVLSEPQRRQLNGSFEAGNRKLEQVFGLDLGLWGTPRTAGSKRSSVGGVTPT